MNIKTPILFLILAALTMNVFGETTTPKQSMSALYEGTWTKKNFGIKGTWKIVEENEGRFLELDEHFKTKKAPDLKLFLSKTALKELSNDNTLSSSVLISPLRAHKGAQRYEIKKEIVLSDFQTLVIHCEKYTKLWGGASLQGTQTEE